MTKGNWIIAGLISHAAVGIVGFALGIYMLPILIAPDAPSEASIVEMSKSSLYQTEFKRDLQDSDGFHWGEGIVTIGADYIAFNGELAPGPDYKLYLSKTFVETEADFNRLKLEMLKVGEVKTFDNFIVDLPVGTDVSRYNSVIVWCETFGEFITAGKYQ